MKKLLIFLVLVGYTSFNYSQTLIQTFTDRCTGATQVFQIAMTGTTTVVFYDRAQSFTAADVQSGAFQAWLEETYAWWATLNPCSAAQAESTTAQQTAQQTTSAATSAATAAASTPPPTTSSTTPPPTTNTSSNATSSSTDTSSTSQSTDTSSSSSSESSQTETSDSSSGGESTEDSGGGESTESESESTEESSSEESSEEESSEESESEEKSDEESNEDSEESDEEDKKEEKKKNLAPPILAANMMSMQMLDGSWSTAASFGLSQSSLTGQETYSANAMIWTNFKQFSLALSKTKLHFWSEYEGINYLVSQSGKKIVSRNKDGIRPIDRQNQIHHVGTTSFNYMNIFGTNVITGGYSHVILGQKDNFWKGFAGGYAAMSSLIILPESLLLSPSLTFFGTKPLAFRSLPRWGFAPMTAISLTPIQLSYQDNKVSNIWNPYFNYIVGTNINFKLTQRFVANLGINTINNTNPIIPTTFAITIGARFAF